MPENASTPVCVSKAVKYSTSNHVWENIHTRVEECLFLFLKEDLRGILQN